MKKMREERGASIQQSDSRLRVAYSYFQSAKGLNTARIRNIYEYQLLNNLYSRLVEYDKDAQLSSGVAESFSITDDEIVFKFGDKVTTIDGHKIDALDAAISLKRLIIFGGHGHGDIRRFLCPNHRLNSVYDECPGIQVKGNALVLRPVRQHFVPLLMSTLESADHSIVPRTSLDSNSPNLPIVDYRNTSGPYFIEKDSNDGAFVLKANPSHYHYDAKMPQTVELVPTLLQQGSEALLSGTVDMTTTAEYYSGEVAESLINDTNRFNVHESIPIQVDLVCFSKAAVEKYSVAQRVHAAKIYTEIRLKTYRTIHSQRTVQFFQALSDGSLLPDQLRVIESLRNSTDKSEFYEPIELGIFNKFIDRYYEPFRKFPEIKLLSLEEFPFSYPEVQRPQMFGIATDSAWSENLSLLGHAFEERIFQLKGLDSNKWLEDYLATTEKEKRIEKINSLHFDLLRNVAIFPYNVSPYFAVATKKWELNFSKLSSDTPIWQIRMN